MSRVATLALLALAACRETRPVVVQVLVPDLSGVETPLPGAIVTALPYDRDSILSAMERRAPAPRPHTQVLDSLFQAFRIPFLGFGRVAWQMELTRRLRDSLSTRRAQAAPDSPGARELDGRIGALDDSLRHLAPILERTRAALSSARDTLWPRIERLRGDTRRWELTTYAGYDTITQGIVRDHLRRGFTDTTDARGWVSIVLPAGRWWIYARSPDPQDPNAHWYWNLPVSGDTLRLTPATARHLPRY